MKYNVRIILISLLSFITVLMYREKLLFIVTLLIFILIGALSKLYHRFFRSAVGIDLVFFSTMVMALAYGMIPGLVVGWTGLILADTLGTRFSQWSFVSLAGLTTVTLVSQLLGSLSPLTSIFLLIILYEITTVALYRIMGSSWHKITVYWLSHLLFNITVAGFARELIIRM